MLAPRHYSRKSRFRAALILAETTAQEWAAEIGVTHYHLSFVLNGKRESSSLCEKIDAFAQTHLRAAA